MGTMERPGTASAGGAKVRELQEELKKEQKEKRKLQEQIEGLKQEIQKQNFASFNQATNVSVNSGRLPPVPGVREITLDDIEVGEKIGQGGFSTIHKGRLNGTPVAIKKIFDPRLTDELLQEIQNEIVMQGILRHPNICILMGVIPKIPDIYIVFEHVT
jgi:serine/threonine protein kinase